MGRRGASPRKARSPDRRREAAAARRLFAWTEAVRRGRLPTIRLPTPGERRAAAVALRLSQLRGPAPADASGGSPPAAAPAGLRERVRALGLAASGGAERVSGGATVDRRAVLATGAAAALGALLTGAALSIWDRAPVRRWVSVGHLADFPPGTIRPLMAGAEFLFVVRDASGRLRALSGACTDVGCPLEYVQARAVLHCPCHGAEFGLDGRPLAGTYPWRPLPALAPVALRLHGDQVQARVRRH